MLHVDLSKLSGPELRRLLDSTRQRGQAAQSYRILQEMEARRGGSRARRDAEVRMIDVDLGDPADRPDELDAPEQDYTPQTEPEPELVWPPEPPPDGSSPLVLQREPLRPKAPRRAPWLMTGLMIGGLAGAGAGWWGRDFLTPPPTAPAAASGLEVVPETLSPSPEPDPPAEQAAVSPAADTPINALPVPDAGALQTAASESAAPVDVAQAAPTGTSGCAAEPVPAERAICEHPELQQLQRELREAYAEALEAHADRALLRQRQLAWRDARSGVSDPERLARIYEARIGRLHAATDQARRRRLVEP